MRIGSLFSGAGGLDMAVEEVFGGEVIWQSELDTSASKVLAYRFPCAPNLGDITQVDWATVETPDVLCGGFPCQDVSAAGKRAGIKAGTRSGLWSVFADAIEALRPPFVVIENVRGLLSATAQRTVDGDSLESQPGVVGDGAGRPVLRAIGAVLGDLADLGYDAQWATVAASSIGAPHRRERVFIVAHAESARRSVRDTAHIGAANPEIDSSTDDCGIASDSACDGRHEGRPEPTRIIGRSDAAIGSDGHVDLLPTPNAQDGNGGGRYSSEGHQSTLPGEVRLLPTPQARDFKGTDSEADHKRNSPGMDAVTYHFLPTPAAADGQRGQDFARAGRDASGGDDLVTLTVKASRDNQWGKYAPAIHRWEQIAGRAPSPTEPNKNGNPRLSAAFSEWMMGWPAGWVTDPDIGISRNDQLKIVGNGVCPQQAAAALRYLLTVTEAVA